MLWQVGTRIDHRHVFAADDIDAGSLEGERTRIVGNDPADQGRDLHELAVARIELPDERNGHQFLPSASEVVRDWMRACRSIERGCERARMARIFLGARWAKCSSM